MYWGAIEADFLRDYNINLIEALPVMSWRRFITLFNNLSERAITRLLMQGEKPQEQVDDKELTPHEVARMFGL